MTKLAQFGVLNFDETDRTGPDNAASAGRELTRIPEGSTQLRVDFPDVGVFVRLAPIGAATSAEAGALVAAAGPRQAQVGLDKLRQWVGPISFPMFAHYGSEPPTLRIPRMDSTVIEVGALPDRPHVATPELPAWVNENLR